MMSKIGDETDIFLDRLEDRILYLQEKAIARVTSVIVMVLGVFTLIVGIGLFLVEYEYLTPAMVFIIFGVAVFAIGILLRLMKGGKRSYAE